MLFQNNELLSLVLSFQLLSETTYRRNSQLSFTAYTSIIFQQHVVSGQFFLAKNELSQLQPQRDLFGRLWLEQNGIFFLKLMKNNIEPVYRQYKQERILRKTLVKLNTLMKEFPSRLSPFYKITYHSCKQNTFCLNWHEWG